MIERDFYYVLYTTLLANCPKDKHNMVQNITLTDMGDVWLIRISGPTAKGYDYARAVNEMQGVVKSGRNKGKVNYKWIERTVEQVSRLFGKEVRYELS